MGTLQINFWLIVFSFSALHGFFIAFILFLSMKGRKKENRILASLVFLISLILSIHAFYLIGFFEKVPHLIYANLPLWFIFGPLFYYYFHTLLAKPTGFRWLNTFHFFPLAICIFIMFPFYSMSSEEKLALLHGTGSRNVEPYLFTAILYLYTLQTIAYIVFTSRMLKNYERNYKNESANTMVISIEWLRSLILILIIFLAIDFIIGTTLAILKTQNANYTYSSIIIISFFIYFIAYNLILHPNKVFPKSISVDNRSTETIKYKNSKLGESEIRSIEKKLVEVMRNEKPYLNEELKLPDLAKLINLSPNKLSQFLNQNFNQNFYHYINEYRIQEVQKQLVEDVLQKHSIQTIALQSGFNSNASFYRVFKQKTGLTPTQFIKINSN